MRMGFGDFLMLLIVFGIVAYMVGGCMTQKKDICPMCRGHGKVEAVK